MVGELWQQEEVEDKDWGSVHFLLFILPVTPVHRMMLLVFRVGLGSSVAPVWKNPPRHTLSHVSMETLNPVELLMKINRCNIKSPWVESLKRTKAYIF